MKGSVLCLLALVCGAGAILPGFDDQLFCPPGHCLKRMANVADTLPMSLQYRCYNTKDGSTVTAQSVGRLSFDAAQRIASLLAKGYTQDKCKVVSNGGSQLGACPDTAGMIGTCAMMCIDDSSCGEGKRCCSNGCGRACMEVAVATPEPKSTAVDTDPQTPKCGICPVVKCEAIATKDDLCTIVPAPKDECGCSGCPTVVCKEPQGCKGDGDCGDTEFCQQCRGDQPAICKPKLALGKTCGGFIMCPGTCQDDLKCVMQKQPPFGPQMSDMPHLCCPPKSAECSCGPNEYMLLDEHGCNSCKCAPSPCGEGVAPIEDAWCGPNEKCDDGHECTSYKGPFGPDHVCCPAKKTECDAMETMVFHDGKEKCCPQVTCRMDCELGWAWENGCPKCGCYEPEDTCIRLFDGCNECTKDGDGWACTEMYCKVRKEPKCLEHAKPTIPEFCSVWFDGCNTCRRSADGEFDLCTKKLCKQMLQPICREYYIPNDCVSWNDGCNDCIVKDGVKVGCTKKLCLVSGEPFCKEYAEKPTCGTCPVVKCAGPPEGQKCRTIAPKPDECGCTFCPTYDCEPMCGPVCAIFCEHGNVMDDKGCPTCKCRDKPEGCAPMCPTPMCLAPPEGKNCKMIPPTPDKCGCTFCPTYECEDDKEPITTDTPVDTTLTVSCTDGRDDMGNKCNCKDISGCRACTITKVGEKREEKCVECEADRFSVDGKCPKTQVCKGEKLQGTGAACKCRGTKYCHSCIITTDDSLPSQCTSCKRDTFFHEGSCLETCPEGLAHVGKASSSYARSCQAPHACVKGKVATEGHPRFGKKCRCHSSDCLDCHFHAHSTGIKGTCNRCTNKLFHHEGECKAECPGHLTHHGLKKNGRACIAPFTCSHDDAKAGKCHCHKSCKGCSWKAGNAEKQHACLACRRKKLSPGPDGLC